MDESLIEKLGAFLRRGGSRRDFMKLAALGGLLAGCGSVGGGERLPLFFSLFDRLNTQVGRIVFSPQRLAPRFTKADLTPDQMRPNGSIVYPNARFIQTPRQKWRLSVAELRAGRKEPLWVRRYTLDQMRRMPAAEEIVRHVCVEGWSAICWWRGVRLREFLALHQRGPESRYVLFVCDDFPDGLNRFHVSYDLAAALHPQNILAYEYNGKPLPFEHGAPLRLAAPTKVGWKSAKYISQILLVDQDVGGYWEQQGYPRYYGF
ncbi:MAG: molybdopterin-dependent oxidoreductase [Nitrospinota bacterium]